MTAFVVRRFMGCGLLVDLSASPGGTLRRPGRVHRVCRREDLADLVAPGTPLGPEQAASYRPGRPLGPIAPHVFSATRPAPDP